MDDLSVHFQTIDDDPLTARLAGPVPGYCHGTVPAEGGPDVWERMSASLLPRADKDGQP